MLQSRAEAERRQAECDHKNANQMKDVLVELFRIVGNASQGNLEGACKVLSMIGVNVLDFFASVMCLRANAEPRP